MLPSNQTHSELCNYPQASAVKSPRVDNWQRPEKSRPQHLLTFRGLFTPFHPEKAAQQAPMFSEHHQLIHSASLLNLITVGIRVPSRVIVQWCNAAKAPLLLPTSNILHLKSNLYFPSWLFFISTKAKPKERSFTSAAEDRVNGIIYLYPCQTSSVSRCVQCPPVFSLPL